MRAPDLASAFDRRRWFGVAVVGGSMAVLLLLGTHNLSTKSFWYDEAMSVSLARMPPAEMVRALADREANGSLYFAILSAWRTLGEGEARIRFLSVLLAAATVPLLYLVGRRHVGAAAALVACALFAVNPFVIEYAQEARMYGLALLLTTAAVTAWSFATETDGARWWAAYALAAIAAAYTHFFCGFVALGLGITWVLGVVPRTRSGALAQVAIGIGVVPIAIFVAASGLDQVAWILPISDTSLSSVLGMVGAGSVALALLLYAGALTGLVAGIREGWRRIAPIAAWWIAPFASGIGISLSRSVLIDRYFIVALPAILLLAGAGCVRLGEVIAGDRWPAAVRDRGALLAGIASGLVVALLSAGLLGAWYTAPRWDWRSAAGWVAGASRPGDRIAYVPDDARLPMALYLDRMGASEPVEASLDELRATGRRTWLVLYLIRGVQYDGLAATLPGYRVVESKRFSGVRVQLIAPDG